MRSGWLDVREKGGALEIRWMVWLCTAFGHRPARAFLAVLCLYYVAFHRGVRRASREYLTRIHGSATFGAVYRHVLCFAHCALDRFFLLRGRDKLFTMTSHGTEHLRDTQAAGRGAILLGAHVGSFEAMRAVGQGRNYRINVVGYSGNARAINAALSALNPELATRVVEIRPDGVEFIFAVKELIEKGEFVAILGDRVGLGGKSTVAEFLGSPARFPVGPYVLAASLRCPVFLTFGLFHEPDRYELYCEPFAEEITLNRRDRAGALARYAAQYAQRLEHYCRLAPDNWFNFFDFWGDS